MFWLAFFVVVQFSDNVRDAYAKKTDDETPAEGVDDFFRAGKNTPSLALCYIFTTGWDNKEGKKFLRSDFQSLKLCIIVLYVDSK